MALAITQDLLTNVPEIDAQHQELIRRIDTLLQAWESGRGSEEVQAVLKYLEDYVIEHFGTEERYMDRYGYTNRTAHKSQHQVFVKTFLRLKERYLTRGADKALIAETNDVLVDYFLKHIRYADKALALFLKTKLTAA